MRKAPPEYKVVRAHVGNGYDFQGLSIDQAYQKVKELADSRNMVDEKFILLYGDELWLEGLVKKTEAELQRAAERSAKAVERRERRLKEKEQAEQEKLLELAQKYPDVVKELNAN